MPLPLSLAHGAVVHTVVTMIISTSCKQAVEKPIQAFSIAPTLAPAAASHSLTPYSALGSLVSSTAGPRRATATISSYRS